LAWGLVWGYGLFSSNLFDHLLKQFLIFDHLLMTFFYMSLDWHQDDPLLLIEGSLDRFLVFIGRNGLKDKLLDHWLPLKVGTLSSCEQLWLIFRQIGLFKLVLDSLHPGRVILLKLGDLLV
jgi:hypothetical protein